MSRARMRRVNEIMREVVAEEIERLKDPGLGFVTVTGVDTAPDLKTAKVYYSVLGDEAQREATAAALKRAAPRIRSVVGREVRMKYTPKLRFQIDESIEEGMRIDEILRGLQEERDESDPTGDPQGG